jgi:outer membrane protein TolC
MRAFLCLALFCTPLFAETFQPEPELVRDLLFKNNRDYKQSLATREQARMEVMNAGSRALPSIDVTGTLTRLGEISSFEFPSNDPNDPPQELLTAAKDNYTVGISASQLLFSGSVFYAIGVARSYDAVAEAQLEVERANLLHQFIDLYSRLEMLSDLKELTADQLEQHRLRLEDARLLKEIGQLSRYDLLRNEVEYLNAIPAKREAENAYDAARDGLKLMLDLKANTDLQTWPLTLSNEKLETLFPKVLSGSAEEEALIEYALGHRSEIKLSQNATEGYKRAVKIYHSERLPTIAAFANWDHQNQWDMFSQTDDDINSWNVGLQMSLPLFTGFRTHSQIQKGKLELKKSRLQESTLHDGIRLEVRSAHRDLQRSNADLAALQHAVEIAQEGLSIATSLRESGRSSELELRDARTALKAAGMHLAEGRHAYLIAQSTLLKSLGELETCELGIRNETIEKRK